MTTLKGFGHVTRDHVTEDRSHSVQVTEDRT